MSVDAAGNAARARVGVAAVLALLSLSGAWGQAGESVSSPIPATPAVRADAAPTIDGKLDEPEWAGACAVAGFTRVGSDRPASQPTVVRLLFDESALYVGFLCYEPNPDELAHTHSGPDAAVWFDDSVELFIDPGHSHQRYLQFALNCTGATFDRRMDDIEWTDEWMVGTWIGDDRWTAEVAIPFTTLGCEPPEEGAVFSANFCRNRKTSTTGSEEHGEWSCWAPVLSDYHEPRNFGHILFSEASDDVPLHALAEIAANALCTHGEPLTRSVQLALPSGVVEYAPHRARAMAELSGDQSEAAGALGEVERLLAGDRWDDPDLREDCAQRLSALRSLLDELRERAGGDTDAAALQSLRVDLRQLRAQAQDLLWDVRFELLFAGLQAD